jgi:hypothetical protein
MKTFQSDNLMTHSGTAVKSPAFCRPQKTDWKNIKNYAILINCLKVHSARGLTNFKEFSSEYFG